MKAGERDPLHVLKELLGRYTYVPAPELPPFVGGAVGMIGYDTVRFFEKLPSRATDDLGLDDCLFLFTDALLIFDNVKHKILALCNAHIAPGEDPGAAYDAAALKVEALLGRLKGTASPAPNNGDVGAEGAASGAPTFLAPPPSTVVGAGGEFVPNRTEADYKAAVLRAKEYIAAGDTFQAQIGQRLSKTLHADPFDVYRALRSINPSPYMFYLDFGEIKLVGASPRNSGRRTPAARSPSAPSPGRGTGGARRPPRTTPSPPTCWPTRRSGRNTSCWWTSPATTSAESRKYGTVSVDELMVIEKYSHVMHIVSEVTGTLRDGLDQFDVLRANFPAGTLTGAPKVRTMEIIEELEPTRRGHYGGGIGYFSFSGDMDTAITIRTALVKGDTIYLQAAGGVVADSVPEYEYRETLAKMRALTRAVEWAEAGLE